MHRTLRTLTLWWLALALLLALTGCDGISLPTASLPSPTPTPTTAPVPTTAATRIPSRTPTATPFHNRGEFTLVTPLKDILPGRILEVRALSGGPVWVISTGGAVWLPAQGGKPQALTFTGDYLGMDSANRLWTYDPQLNEISYWQAGSWTKAGTQPGWLAISNLNEAVLPPAPVSDGAGNTWLATGSTIRRFDGTRWTVYNPAALQLNLVQKSALKTSLTLGVDSSGRVTAGACIWENGVAVGGYGLRRYNGSIWTVVESTPETGCVSALAQDAGGHLWASIDNQLWQVDPPDENQKPIAPPALQNSARYNAVVTLSPDRVGGLWPVYSLCNENGCQGLKIRYHLQNGLWTVIGNVSGLAPVPLVFAPGGETYYLEESGVYQLVNDQPRLLSPLKPLAGAVDAEGRFWLAAGKEDITSLWVSEEKR